MNDETLQQLTPQQRLEAFNLITAGCEHLWSKGKMQEEKVKKVLDTLIPLTKDDPYFLSHLTSYALTKTKNKDLQIMTTFVNSLSTADGQAFSPGSRYMKPNLRYVSYAAVHRFDPAMALRMNELAQDYKFDVKDYLNYSKHFSSALRTSLKRYLQYREANPSALQGIAQAGLGKKVRKMYKMLKMVPQDEVAKVIHFRVKGKKLTFEKPFSFTGKTDLEVAEYIREKEIPANTALTSLDRPLSPVIAIAILEQATGNQAVIYRRTLEDTGVLKDPEVLKLFQEKLISAKTALDRVEHMSKTASEEVQQVMKQARAAGRKKEVGDIGSIFMYLDFSVSMHGVLEFAKDRGVIFAECVENPEKNFCWGWFSDYGEVMPLPKEFVKDAFAAELFGKTIQGGTNCFALYPAARMFGADVDVFVSDQGNTYGDLGESIKRFHKEYPDLKKPKACVIVDFSRGLDSRIKQAYEQNDIPVAVMQPETLTETALVAEAVRSASLGPVALVEEIMKTKLLELPEYYFTL